MCTESLRAAIADFAESFFHTWMGTCCLSRPHTSLYSLICPLLGALSKWQRILFVSLIVASVAINGFFLDYVISKTQHAAANPITLVSRTPASPFPDWIIFLNAVSAGSSPGPHSNSTRTQWCNILNTPDLPTTCALLNQNNQIIGGGVQMLPSTTAPVLGQFQCINLTSHSFLIHVPGALWSNHSWMPVQVAMEHANCWLYSSIMTATDSANDRGYGPAAYSQRYRDQSVITLGVGFTTYLELTAW